MNTWIVGKDLLHFHWNAFYSKLYREDVTDQDYQHVQKVFEEFKFKNLDQYHYLYVQSYTLLLAD